MAKGNNPKIAELGKPYRFKPGAPSANPFGRPPKIKSLTSWMREELTRPAHEVTAIRKLCSRMSIPDEYPIGRVLALALIIQALKGNSAAVKEVWMRSDGAPKEAPAPEGEEREWDREDLILRIKRALEMEPLEQTGLKEEEETMPEKVGARRGSDEQICKSDGCYGGA